MHRATPFTVILIVLVYSSFRVNEITEQAGYVLNAVQGNDFNIGNSINIYTKIPLEQLLASNLATKCTDDFHLMEDILLPMDGAENRKIPKIVHVTSKSRCMTSEFYTNLVKWQFPGYSFALHDDEAMDRLLSKKWIEFPQLGDALKCLVSGAAKADVWRYLALWEYGGIYTDIDNAPGDLLLNGSAITPYIDSFFEQEKDGFPSQYFFASAPRHPLMFYAVHHAMSRLLSVEDVAKQYVPFVTGPGAIKSAMVTFINNGYPTNGTYTGFDNRTVTVVGNPSMAMGGKFCRRNSVRGGAKSGGYAKMGMKHYGEENPVGFNEPCHALLFNLTQHSMQPPRRLIR